MIELIRFQCPKCGKVLKAPPNYVGRFVRCARPTCNERLEVPEPLPADHRAANAPQSFDEPQTLPLPIQRKNPSSRVREPAPKTRRRRVPVAVWETLAVVALILLVLGAGYWWLWVPSSDEQAICKDYLRTGNELVEMHLALSGETVSEEEETKLRDKAQEHVDARIRLLTISTRKKKYLEDKYDSELKQLRVRLVGLFTDYMDKKLPVLFVWGIQSGQFTEFMSEKEGTCIVVRLGGPTKTTKSPTGIPSIMPPKKPDQADATINTLAGDWETPAMQLSIQSGGRGRFTWLFSDANGAQFNEVVGELTVTTKENKVLISMAPTVFGRKEEYQFAASLSEDKSTLELEETGARVKSKTLKRKSLGKPEPGLVKGKRDTTLEGEWRASQLFRVYTGREKDELSISGEHKISIQEGKWIVSGSVDGKKTTLNYDLELDPTVEPRRFKITNPANANDYESGIYRVDNGTLLIRTEKFGDAAAKFDFSGISISQTDAAGRDSDIPKGFLRRRGDKGAAILKFGRPVPRADDKDKKANAPGVWKIAEVRSFEAVGQEVAFSADGTRIISISGEMELHEWEVATGKQVRHLPAQDKHELVGISADFRFGLSMHRSKSNMLGQLHLWDLTNGKSLRSWEEPVGEWDTYAPHGCLSPEGKQVMVLYEEPIVKKLANGGIELGGKRKKQVFLWDGQTGRVITPVSIQSDGSISISPDGQWLATNDEQKNVLIWDVKTGKKVRKLSGAPGTPLRLHFSADRKYIAASCSADMKNPVIVWDAATGNVLYKLTAQKSFVRAAVFSSDGRTLLCAERGDDQKGILPVFRLYEAATGRELGSFEVPQMTDIYAVAFSPEGTSIVSAGYAGKKALVQVWTSTK